MKRVQAVSGRSRSGDKWRPCPLEPPGSEGIREYFCQTTRVRAADAATGAFRRQMSVFGADPNPWRKTDVRPFRIRKSKKMARFKIVDRTFCFCTGTGGVRKEPLRGQWQPCPLEPPGSEGRREYFCQTTRDRAVADAATGVSRR